MKDSVRHYRILEKLGEGGMGVVYAARDERLDRTVALKMLSGAAPDPRARERLWREARFAASVNHPNICQIHEVGEEDGEVFVVMELLEGESLAARIASGPLPIPEALGTTLGILSALEALHARGIVHRDLKPSNVFLTTHGVKLLDFGLARSPRGSEGEGGVTLTAVGHVVGTPRYMAPEQWGGSDVGPAADQSALGAILFEMVTGKPAFAGATLLEICHAVANEHPPALAGGAAAAAVDRIIHRALEKKPQARYPDVAAMARDVRAAMLHSDSGEAPRVRPMTRLLVLPFRTLRPDPETDFLGISVPEAITATLSGIESLVVRSSVVASRFASATPDLKKIAAEAEVDAVLVGTFLRAGDQVRVSTQLVEAPGGTTISSKTVQLPIHDIFGLQDEVTRQIVESLSPTLSARERGRLSRDVPATARAYELYLRANEVAKEKNGLPLARDLYKSCIDEDPRYAPAWARLGRVYRVMAKYTMENSEEHSRLAEQAFGKALEISPELSIAHTLYTYFELEDLGRPIDAMSRLIGQAHSRPSDYELFSGLVPACRFCGLLDASVEADRRARLLDPTIKTSVSYTYWLMGDFERAIEHADDWEVRYASMAELGRVDEALAGFRALQTVGFTGVSELSLRAEIACLEQDRDACSRAVRAVFTSGFRDPEALYMYARLLLRTGDIPLALESLRRAVRGGLLAHAVTAVAPWLDPLRADPEFVRITREAEAGHREAAEAYARAGGERLLGVAAR